MSLPSISSVYLAGPFFNPEQIEVVRSLEASLEMIGLRVWSPSRDGTALPSDASDSDQKRVFESNFEHIDSTDLMVAIVEPNDIRPQSRVMQIWEKIFSSPLDEMKSVRKEFKLALYEYEESVIAKQVMPQPQYPDIGTVWEMGYAFKACRPVIMYAGSTLRKPNLMLAKSCIGVARTPDELNDFILDYKATGNRREYTGSIT